MADVSRRSVLKTMTRMSMAAAGASLAPWISGCCRNDYGKVRLNVVLHGLFLLDITDSGVELLTPDVTDHRFRYGEWDIEREYNFSAGRRYELKETRNSPPPSFPKPCGDPDCAVNITHDKYEFSVNPAKSKFSVKLPIPDEVYLLRCVSAPTYEAVTNDDCARKILSMNGVNVPIDPSKKRNEPPSQVICKADYGGYPASNCVNITKLSLCQVLVYKDSEFCELKLHGSCWKPSYPRPYKSGGDGNAVNLHFWAEPEKRTTPKHANEAYAQLQTLLPPLSLNLQVYATAPLDYQAKAPGVPPEQEQGWADWASGGGEGTRPTNCCTAMVSPKPITG
jgi:hypothetical protein